MPVHVCPVCGARHVVSSVLHQLAYRRSLTCSPSCKATFGQRVRRRILAEMAESAERRRVSDHHPDSED
ncbi:MAG: hypothetical protein JSR83_07615 [Proteobacteria bacterium]|nr:hypothetical protein [Pseudomonadota bacterium]